MKRLTVLLLAASFGAAALLSPSAFAQASAAPASAAPAAPAPAPNLRFFQSFITEAGIADRQWYGIDYTYDNGAVPPIQGANGWALTPTVAISFFKNLEVGGRISWLDYTLNNDVVRYPGDDFSGASGFGDLTLWGKYRFINGPVAVTAGTYIVLPTASNDDGLGTGQVNWALFGAARVKTGPGYFDGSITVQFNHDATVMGQPLNGKTSFTLAANYMWQMDKASLRIEAGYCGGSKPRDVRAGISRPPHGLRRGFGRLPWHPVADRHPLC